MASFLDEYLQVRADMRGAHRDAAGLVREAVGVLRTAPPGTEVADRIAVILVDDAQELTLGGVELLEACRARGIAVIAFGDPDVGSGAFRGATPENFARLAAGLGGVSVLACGAPRNGLAERARPAGDAAHRRSRRRRASRRRHRGAAGRHRCER